MSINNSKPYSVLNGMFIFLALYCSLAIAQSDKSDSISAYSSLSVASVFEGGKEIQKNENDVQITLPQWNYLSGNWWGVRKSLEDFGLDFHMVYKGEIFSNVYGGIEKGTKALDNIDIILNSDLHKILGWSNTNLLIQFLGNSGQAPSELAGADQGVSNIETIPTWKLYQLIFENKFFDEKLSVAFGLYDLNSEFDTRQSSLLFINPSHGIGPDLSQSGLNGPSIFPTTSLSLRLKYEFDNGNYFQTAFLDGVPGNIENPYGTHIIFDKNDGLLLIAEFGIVDSDDELLKSKIAFGAWTYTSNFERPDFTDPLFDNISYQKNFGFYFNAEKLISSFNNSSKSIYSFLRIGYANKNINPVDFYFSTGLKFSGMFLSDEDELGIALAVSHNSSFFRLSSAAFEDIYIREYEVNLEATYSMQITPWFKLQPDVQFIINPSYSQKMNSALMFGSRMELSF